MKRGQTQEIFVWLFVLIVAAAILFFGIKLIKKSEGLKDEVLIVKLFNDIDKKLSQYYFLDKGSSGEERFLLPRNIEWVCFAKKGAINFNYLSRPHVGGEDGKLMRDILGILDEGTYVFVGPLNLYENNRFKLNIKIKTEVLCKEVVNGVLSLDLENKGVSDGIEVK
ncbi:hypothetical protein HYV89_04720 [Candidatus Woesearchaeota archaeon]|nr:hypothetical protein [Candidatus Woesearchaeota archaeon]